MNEIRRHCALFIFIGLAHAIQPTLAANPDSWIPARWQVGPPKLDRRTQGKALPADPALRETILQRYDLSTGVAIKDAVSDFESHRIPGPAQARRRGASPGIQLPDAGHHEIRV